MISYFRMKIDLVGQSVLIASLILLVLLTVSQTWLIVLITALALWQAGSALELAIQYEYHARVLYIWLLPIMVVLLFLLKPLFGIWMLIGTGITLLSYYVITARDLVIVARRPRSFWDI